MLILLCIFKAGKIPGIEPLFASRHSVTVSMQVRYWLMGIVRPRHCSSDTQRRREGAREQIAIAVQINARARGCLRQLSDG
jgi:hypothetical protein